jgi:hypothetical protein
MVSDEPLPDRCGASVTNKVGLEVHDHELEEVFSSTDRLDSVVLERGAVRAEKEPEYEEVREYMSQGFSLAQVNLRPSDADEDDPRIVPIDVEDDDPDTRNVDTEHEGYCERFPMDNGRCYVHGGAGAGAPEGNVNAMTHGLRAKRSNYYENLVPKEKAFIEAMADSWIDNAPFGKDNFAKVNEVYRLSVDQHRLWNAHDEFDKGLVYEQVIGQDEEGEPIEVEDENPVNLAYDRLDRTTIRKLKELGCLDDPESQKAEQMESLADKFAKLDQ